MRNGTEAGPCLFGTLLFPRPTDHTIEGSSKMPSGLLVTTVSPERCSSGYQGEAQAACPSIPSHSLQVCWQRQDRDGARGIPRSPDEPSEVSSPPSGTRPHLLFNGNYHRAHHLSNYRRKMGFPLICQRQQVSSFSQWHVVEKIWVVSQGVLNSHPSPVTLSVGAQANL